MRLATFNLLHGRSVADWQVDHERLEAAAATLDADVVGLQEVDRDQPRSGGADLAAIVARGMGAVAWRFLPAVMGTPGQTWRAAHDGDDTDASAGEPAYGVGLASRYPVTRWTVVRLPAAPVSSPVPLPGGGHRWMMLRDEPRVALAALVQTPAGSITAVSTHLSFVPGWNGFQLLRLHAALRALPDPVVILGDLNLPHPLPSWLPGWRSMATRATYPGPDPRVQVDHVLARGPLPDVLATEALDLGVSDHRALVVTLAARMPPR